MVDDSLRPPVTGPDDDDHHTQARNWPALAAVAMWIYTHCVVRCCCGAPTKDDLVSNTRYRDDESESAAVPMPASLPRSVASVNVQEVVDPAAVSTRCAATPSPDPHIALSQTQ